MEYTKTEWEDRIVENPMTFSYVTNDDGTITLTPVPGEITSEGTKVKATLLNNIEDGIDALYTFCKNEENFHKVNTYTDEDELTTTGTYFYDDTTGEYFVIRVVAYDAVILQEKWLLDKNTSVNTFYVRVSYDSGSTWIGWYQPFADSSVG